MRIQLFIPPWLVFLCLIQFLIAILVSGQCTDDQKSSLLQLRSALVFNSASSTKLVKWNQSDDDCCRWDGVGCDGAGRVITLDLENEGIGGGIEDSSPLFKLKSLEKLNLAFNLFSTQIPKGLQNLTNLAYLNLSNAGFGGQIPIEVATLSGLQTLDLSILFKGVQPLTLENPNLQGLVQGLPRLRELYLDNVNISTQKSDWFQALASSVPELTALSLRSCGLSGPLHPSLAELHSLSILRLDGNNLSTKVPDFAAYYPNLATLTLGNCFLQGTFPDTIFKVQTLQTLDLSNNLNLSGFIPELPVKSSLRTMVLSYTDFSGPLPNSIGHLRMLSRIELSNCNFTGLIPITVSNLTELVYMDFSFNSFIGSIPPFSMSSKLTYLDLSRNSLRGSLSSNHFEGLSNLVFLNLGFNSLSGSIPPLLFDLPSLKNIQLSNNQFSKIAEFSISNSSILDTVDLSSNRLNGSIPESFFKCEGLSVLSLSSNLFNGTLKLEKFQRFPNLTRLELGHNNLSVDTSNSSLSRLPQLSRLNLASCNLSDFPDLRKQSKLIFLDLSNNHIPGEIPSWIWGIGGGALFHFNLSSNLLVGLQKPVNMSPFLTVVDLHSNRLQGEFPMPPQSAVYVDYSSNKFQQTIPVNIGVSVSFALFFSLANNSLTGTIPESLCKASYLQVLDLSHNNLSGSIPNCLINSYSLAVLNLRGNNLGSQIPDLLSPNCGLRTLDLSENNLGGKLPLSMANCKSLEVLNVGNNMIDDAFPCRLKNSSSLRVLVLRSNKFYGDIKCSEVNGSWPNLQIIDLAFNNFSGEINPRCISTWKGMMLDDGTQLSGDHIRFEFLILSNIYYQDAVTVTIKGLELELVKILTVFTAIDVSCNNFSGRIPDTVGDLSSLYVLNLSHNSFSGEIPRTIGNLSQLGSLDLSRNQLTGRIPQELSSLNFLAVLNLSYNKLVGMIPEGTQLQTFSAQSYAGNPELCGFPLNQSCSIDPTKGNLARRWNSIDFNWQFIFTGLGYGVGVSLILAPLAFCKEWREKFEEQVDQILKLIYPGYGFSYVRQDEEVKAVKKHDDETTDDDEDDDDDEDTKSMTRGGNYCVFCTKLDIQIRTVMHNPKCTCHFSPPRVSSTPTSSSSSSSTLLVIYC